MSSCCIIIPCYNEQNRLNQSAFLQFLKSYPSISCLFVNDGSIDKTQALLEKTLSKNPNQILIHQLKNNVGKAEAVRQGMLIAFEQNFEIIGFWDADLSAPLSQVPLMYEEINSDEVLKIVLGSRIKRLGATIQRNPLRHYFGRIFSTFSSVILKLPVYDSQCGAKLFRRESIQPLFDKPFITKWLFDVEFFIRFRNHFGVEAALGQIKEFPLQEWKEVGGSKLKLTDFIKVPFELLKINATYN